MKLLKKKVHLVEGVLFLKKENVERTVLDLCRIADILKYDAADLELLSMLLRNSNGNGAIEVPVFTTEKRWEKIKKSKEIKTLIASTERVTC